MGEKLIAILPLVSLILASLSIAGLWYWWTSTSGDEEPEEESAAGEQMEEADLTVGDLLGKVTGFARSVLPAQQFPPEGVSRPAQAMPPGGYAPPLADEGAVEVLRVLRDLADGSLIVEIGGQRYRRLSEIADPQIKRRLVGNTEDLTNFVQLAGGMVAPPSAPPPTPQPPPAAAPPPAPEVAEARPQAKVRARGKDKNEEEEQPEPKSIAEEIEELLQARLAATPELARRRIHIHEAMGGGVTIEVDGKHYGGIGEVTDDEVQEFIQAVIQEWEARQ
jgi:Tfp pilus assembly protein PilP